MTTFSSRARGLLWASLCAAAAGCATLQGANPRLTPLTAAEAACVLPLPRQPAADVQQYLAEGRLTHFGHGQRLRAQLQLLVARPDRFRYTVLTPQGPPAFVLASDGTELTSLDVGASHFAQAEASAAGLRQLAPALDFGLSPQRLVQLLFAGITPPADAQAAANAERLRYAWREDDVAWQADWARKDGRLLQLTGTTPAPQPAGAAAAAAASTVVVRVLHWRAEGLPGELAIDADGPAFGGGKQSLRIVLDRYNLAPTVGPRAFAVRP